MTAKSDYSGNGKVSIGDGSQLSISHIGHLVVTAPKPLKLKNIFLVPSITKNIISISNFTLENDVIVEFNADCCYVKDNQSKEVLLQGTPKNGLYQLNLPGASQASSSVYDSNLCRLDLQLQQPSLPDSNNLSSYAFFNNAENVPDSACNTQSLLSLWHSRLGHPNKLVLHKVLFQMSINVPSHTPITFCEACQYGKLHQVSFPSHPLHTTAPFQVVHTDVWGPAPLLSIEGYRCYAVFVDDFTRYTWIYPLRLKSEVLSVFEYFNTMVERQFTTQIKCLQSDWGGGSTENSNLCYTNLEFSSGILALIHTNKKEGLKGSTAA